MTLPRNGFQKRRLSQVLLTAALATPLAFAIATAPPFSADTRAQGPSGMLGPRSPALVGSDSVAPTRSGNQITIPSRWACGSSTNNRLTLSNPEGGRFRTVGRSINLRDQSMTVGASKDGVPQEFVFLQTSGGVQMYKTDAQLRDQNRDGVIDGAVMSGSLNAATNFVFDQNSSFVSIPWSQASALGIATTGTCAGDVAQIWIPLADTNGDGRGDSVVLDLDGNGVADPDLFRGPPVTATSVPALGPAGRFVLVMLLGLIGTWFLSRRRHDTGSPASV
jgi:hypothetical protein